MISKKALQEQLNVACKARDRLSAQVERMDSEHQQERERLKEQCAKRVAELNKQIDQQRDEINRMITEKADLAEKLRLAEGREQSAKHDIAGFENAIARLTQPVCLEEVISACSGFECTETAGNFLLQPEDELMPKLILPKANFRLRRNNGFIAQLAAMHEYATFQRDSGTKHAMPVVIESAVEMLFLQKHRANTYILSDPRLATHVALHFLAPVEKVNDWVNLQEPGTVQKRVKHDNVDYDEVVFITTFVLPDPNIVFKGEVDEDFSEEDVRRKQEEKASTLRQEYYKEYLKHYFYKC